MTTEQPERTKEFEQAAAPLVEFLSKLHVNDPYHDFVLADLYDLVNERRDAIIQQANDTLSKINGGHDFQSAFRARKQRIKLLHTIAACQGV